LSVPSTYYNFQHEKLDKCEKEVRDKCQAIGTYVVDPKCFDEEKMASHKLDSLCLELSSVLLPVASMAAENKDNIAAPFMALPTNGDSKNNLIQPISPEAQEKVTDASNDKWTKIVCLIIGLVFIIGGIVGWIGYDKPLTDAMGNIRFQITPYGNYTVLMEHVTFVPLPWSILFMAVGAIIALFSVVWTVISKFLLTKEEEEEAVPEAENLADYFSRQIKLILGHYYGRDNLTEYQIANKTNVPEYAVHEKREIVYSTAAQNRRFYPKFAIGILTDIQVAANYHINRQRNMLNEWIARVNSASAAKQA
jgi:hypothetical protein